MYGFTNVPQTYTPEATPAWMQGGQMNFGAQGYQGVPGMPGKAIPNYFQMPQWGRDAVTGEPLTPEQVQPPPQASPAPPAPAPQQQQSVLPQPDPADQYRQWATQQRMRAISMPGGLDADTMREPDTSYGAYMLRRR